MRRLRFFLGPENIHVLQQINLLGHQPHIIDRVPTIRLQLQHKQLSELLLVVDTCIFTRYVKQALQRLYPFLGLLVTLVPFYLF
jgi:hypothetical protein